ncbi:MAG: hypothetical protein C4522_03910 [Desulfobacteraceae bacterium]|nr:MAG: hypothetical protein C4522_03910 [Desulfobacteraceae bacterium]
MKLKCLFVTVVCLTGFAAPAFAYLDPGAGSFVLQMLIAGIMGTLFTVKMYWSRLKTFFASMLGKTMDHSLENKTEADRKDE